MNAFGKQNSKSGSKQSAVVHRYTTNSSELIVERRDPNKSIIPDIHNSHLERHWPKYLGVISAICIYVFGFPRAGQLLESHPSTFWIGLIAASIFLTLVFSGFKQAADALHTVLTIRKKSRVFLLGMGIGLGYWVHSTFILPSGLLGLDFGLQKILFDGIQSHDWRIVVFFVLQALIYATIGGYMVEFLKKRIFK